VRIALDSSVLIAAHISRAGVCAELLEDVLLHHELVISDFILEELGRKLVDTTASMRRQCAENDVDCDSKCSGPR
jgi:predicted nucleic acid-binding protein